MRHQFDLSTYTEYENEDDAILARVMAESMKDAYK
jgi:hypothetical protein